MHTQFQRSKDRPIEFSNPPQSLAIVPANSSVTLSGKYTVLMVDADVVGTDESAGQTLHWLVNSATISGGKHVVAIVTK